MTAKANRTPTAKSPILTHKQEGVTTLTMNTPERLNGWTMEMMDTLKGRRPG